MRRFAIALPNAVTITGKEIGWSLPKPTQRIIGVHGWMDNCGTWDRLVPLLPRDNHYVLIDLPGHGHSSHLPVYSFHDYCRCLYDLTRSLGWNRFTLLGHSMGAGIVAMYAGVFPAEIDKLIMIEGGAALSAPPDKLPDLLQQFLQARQEILTKPDKVYDSREAMLVKMLERPFSREAAECLLNEGSEQITSETPDAQAGWTFIHDRLLRAPGPFRLTEEQVLMFHRRITCPTLLISADQGWPFPAQFFERLTQAIKSPLIQHRVQGRHHVHLDNPDVVAPFINDFLKGASSSCSSSTAAALSSSSSADVAAAASA